MPSAASAPAWRRRRHVECIGNPRAVRARRCDGAQPSQQSTGTITPASGGGAIEAASGSARDGRRVDAAGEPARAGIRPRRRDLRGRQRRGRGERGRRTVEGGRGRRRAGGEPRQGAVFAVVSVRDGIVRRRTVRVRGSGVFDRSGMTGMFGMSGVTGMFGMSGVSRVVGVIGINGVDVVRMMRVTRRHRARGSEHRDRSDTVDLADLGDRLALRLRG